MTYDIISNNEDSKYEINKEHNSCWLDKLESGINQVLATKNSIDHGSGLVKNKSL
ncbi:7131_t:CDS:2 [Racocetra persica]|uniref:7131_t:CDS:1 n=1 Tax=Racocetra persica TaxID=160502 RepID=A0ACA9PF86_9GLOM|nr:7131_t:CDS:2 [Racocetra persica]